MTIIVPYRDRDEQLSVFLKHMSASQPGADIVVVEQEAGRPFNRGRLLNIGWLESFPSYAVMHDVDMIPLAVDYTPTRGVTQLASSNIQLHGFLGGVTMYDADTFKRAGGYHNDYFSRAEDNEMAHNLHRLGLPVTERFGVFDYLPHERTGPEFIPWLWTKSKQPRAAPNQLAVCKYQITSFVDRDGYTHIKVRL